MSHILQILSDVILPAIGIGFLIWLCWYSLKRSADPSALIFKWVLTGLILCYVIEKIVPGFKAGQPGTLGGGGVIVGLLYMLVVGVILTAIWRHSIIELIASPFASLYDGGNIEVEPKPY